MTPKTDGGTRPIDVQSERSFQRFLNNLPYPSVIHASGKYVYVNKAAAKLYKVRSPKELIGKPALQIIHPDYKKVSRQRIKEVYEKGFTPERENVIVDKKGNVIIVKIASTLINYKGKPSILSTVQDINDQRNFEEKLKASEKQYRQLVENVNEGIIKFDTDEVITYVNKRFCQMVGYSAKELIGKVGHHLLITTKDSMEVVREAIEERYIGKSSKYEVQLKIKSGKLIWTSMNGTPIFDDKGNFAGSMGIVADITVIKKSREELKESEERLNNFMNSAKDVFILLDKDLNLMEINMAGLKLYGLKASEKNKIIGKNIEELSPDIRTSGRLTLHKKVLKTGEPYTIEDFKLHPKFGEKWFVSHAFKVGDGIGIIGREVTQQIKAEQKIKELNETLEQRVISRTIELEKEIAGRKNAVERHTNLVETLTYGVEDIDVKGNILFANRAMHYIYGYKNEELIGRSILDFVAADTERNKLRKYLKVLVREKPKKEPYIGQKKTKKGKIIDVIVDWNYRLDKNKKVVGFSAIITDITEKKRAEEALRESEAQFRSLSEYSPVLIISLDRNGNIRYANRALKGLKVKEVIGSPVYNFIHPDARKTYKQHLSKTFNTGEVSSFELQGYGDNNDLRWFSNRMAPIKSNGKVNTVVLISLDITGSKTAGIRIRESEGRYRRLVETMNEGVMQVDNKDKIVFVNGRICEMSGYSEEELIGKYAYKMLLPTRSKKEVLRIAQERRKGVSSQYEIQVKIKSGELRWFIIDGAPVYDASGKIIGSVGVHLDITERKRIEEELKKSLKEKEILLKEMHHRVKNNLQIVSSLLNMQATSIPNDLVADALRESQDRIQTMAFIHESLYLSEAMSDISIKKYLEPLIKDRIKANAGNTAQIELITDFPDSVLSIDRMLPLGLLMNELITNSIKHAFPNKTEGKIIVTMQKVSTNRYKLNYGDNGIGFPFNKTGDSSDSLGLILIDSFAMQLDGKLKRLAKEGTHYELKFMAVRSTQA